MICWHSFIVYNDSFDEATSCDKRGFVLEADICSIHLRWILFMYVRNVSVICCSLWYHSFSWTGIVQLYSTQTMCLTPTRNRYIDTNIGDWVLVHCVAHCPCLIHTFAHWISALLHSWKHEKRYVIIITWYCIQHNNIKCKTFYQVLSSGKTLHTSPSGAR